MSTQSERNIEALTKEEEYSIGGINIYVGTKILEAKPMNLGEYNKVRGWTIPEDEDTNREGYCVYYPDNYCSWSPKEIFEQCYRKIYEKELNLIDEVKARKAKGE